MAYLLAWSWVLLSATLAVKASGSKPGWVHFTEVTTASGIQFQHWMGEAKLSNILESTGAGVCFIDYDQDGFQDLYFVNGADLKRNKTSPRPSNRLYRNNGDGTFSDVTISSGTGDTGYGHGDGRLRQ